MKTQKIKTDKKYTEIVGESMAVDIDMFGGIEEKANPTRGFPYNCAMNEEKRIYSVSNKPFEDDCFEAEFHSPFITLDTRQWYENKHGSGTSHPVGIQKSKINLSWEIFGKCLDKKVDPRDPSLKEKLESLLEGGITGGSDIRYKLNAREIVSRLMNNERISGETDLNNKYKLWNGEVYTKTELRIEDVLYFCKKIRGNILTSGYRDYHTLWKLIETGFVSIKREDWINMQMPNKLYIRKTPLETIQ